METTLYLIRDASGEVVAAFASKTLAERWLDRHSPDAVRYSVEIIETPKERT